VTDPSTCPSASLTNADPSPGAITAKVRAGRALKKRRLESVRVRSEVIHLSIVPIGPWTWRFSASLNSQLPSASADGLPTAGNEITIMTGVTEMRPVSDPQGPIGKEVIIAMPASLAATPQIYIQFALADRIHSGYTRKIPWLKRHPY
jgi:hypothetical protein